jgi:hypothetical protein
MRRWRHSAPGKKSRTEYIIEERQDRAANPGTENRKLRTGFLINKARKNSRRQFQSRKDD